MKALPIGEFFFYYSYFRFLISVCLFKSLLLVRGIRSGYLRAVFFQHRIQPSLDFSRFFRHALGKVVGLSDVALQVVEFLTSIFVIMNEFPVPAPDRTARFGVMTRQVVRIMPDHLTAVEIRIAFQ